MRPPDPRRARALIAWLVALGAVVALAFVVPGTSSAFTAKITNSANTAAAKTRFLCADTFAGDRRRSRAYFEFALDEPSAAAVAHDSSAAANDGAYEGTNVKDADSPTACPGDGGGAYQLDGSSSRITTTRQFTGMTGALSETVWFKTRTSGKLMGFESDRAGDSSSYDKHLYVDTDGRLVFGVYSAGMYTATSRDTVADGLWHHAAATLSTTAGTALYIDGKLVASNPSAVAAEDNTGYWRVGGGRLSGWPNAPSSPWFTGSLRFAAAYPFTMSAEEIAAEASIGAPGTAREQPTASSSATTGSSATPSPTASATSAATGKPSSTPGPAASEPVAPEPVEPAPETTAAPGGGEATSAPADPGPDPSKTQSTPIYVPDPPPDISTTPDDR